MVSTCPSWRLLWSCSVNMMNDTLEPLLNDEGEEEIDRIREVRHQISAQVGHDPYRLVAYYMDLQRKHAEKLIPIPDAEFVGKG